MFKRINIWLLVLCLTAYSVSSPIKKQPKRNGQVRVTGRIRCYLYPQAAVYANQYPITENQISFEEFFKKVKNDHKMMEKLLTEDTLRDLFPAAHKGERLTDLEIEVFTRSKDLAVSMWKWFVAFMNYLGFNVRYKYGKDGYMHETHRMTNIRSNTRYHVMANMNMVYDAMAFFADIGFVQAVLSFVVRLRRYVNAPGSPLADVIKLESYKKLLQMAEELKGSTLVSCLFDKAFSAKDKLFLELPPELYADVDSIDIAPAAATRVRYFAGNLRAPNSQRSVGQLIEDLKRQPELLITPSHYGDIQFGFAFPIRDPKDKPNKADRYPGELTELDVRYMRTSPNVLYKVLKLYEAVMNALGYKLIEDVTGDLIPIPTSNLKLRELRKKRLDMLIKDGVMHRIYYDLMIFGLPNHGNSLAAAISLVSGFGNVITLPSFVESPPSHNDPSYDWFNQFSINGGRVPRSEEIYTFANFYSGHILTVNGFSIAGSILMCRIYRSFYVQHANEFFMMFPGSFEEHQISKKEISLLKRDEAIASLYAESYMSVLSYLFLKVERKLTGEIGMLAHGFANQEFFILHQFIFDMMNSLTITGFTKYANKLASFLIQEINLLESQDIQMFSDDVKQALRQYFSHPVYYPSNYFLKLQDAREGINTVGLWRRDGVFKRALTEDSCYRAMTTRLDYFNDMKSTEPHEIKIKTKRDDEKMRPSKGVWAKLKQWRNGKKSVDIEEEEEATRARREREEKRNKQRQRNRITRRSEPEEEEDESVDDDIGATGGVKNGRWLGAGNIWRDPGRNILMDNQLRRRSSLVDPEQYGPEDQLRNPIKLKKRQDDQGTGRRGQRAGPSSEGIDPRDPRDPRATIPRTIGTRSDERRARQRTGTGRGQLWDEDAFVGPSGVDLSYPSISGAQESGRSRGVHQQPRQQGIRTRGINGAVGYDDQDIDIIYEDNNLPPRQTTSRNGVIPRESQNRREEYEDLSEEEEEEEEENRSASGRGQQDRRQPQPSSPRSDQHFPVVQDRPLPPLPGQPQTGALDQPRSPPPPTDRGSPEPRDSTRRRSDNQQPPNNRHELEVFDMSASEDEANEPSNRGDSLSGNGVLYRARRPVAPPPRNQGRSIPIPELILEPTSKKPSKFQKIMNVFKFGKKNKQDQPGAKDPPITHTMDNIPRENGRNSPLLEHVGSVRTQSGSPSSSSRRTSLHSTSELSNDEEYSEGGELEYEEEDRDPQRGPHRPDSSV